VKHTKPHFAAGFHHCFDMVEHSPCEKGLEYPGFEPWFSWELPTSLLNVLAHSKKRPEASDCCLLQAVHLLTYTRLPTSAASNFALLYETVRPGPMRTACLTARAAGRN
jgi:hypothetical protein